MSSGNSLMSTPASFTPIAAGTPAAMRAATRPALAICAALLIVALFPALPAPPAGLYGALVGSTAFAAGPPPLPADLPPFGKDKPLPVAQITQKKLGNGLEVWMVPRTGVPRFQAVLVVRGGTASDPDGMLGIGQVLADVLKEGTATRSARRIAEELQQSGGEITAGSGDDAFTLSVNGLAQGSSKMLEILADIAQNAAFPDAEVELAKANAVQSLLAQEAEPSFIVEKAFAAAMFGDHPYRLVAPTQQVIESITPDLLRREFGRRFRPDRALLVLVGAVEGKAMLADAQRSFGGWKAKGAPLAPTPAVGQPGPRRMFVVDRPGSIQSEIRVGRLAPRAVDADYYPVILANTLLGYSTTSRMYQNLREDKGYTYTPNSSYMTYEQGGEVEASAAVRNEVTAAALMEIDYEMDRLGATLVRDDELARAKRFQTGLYLIRNETVGSLSRTLAGNWIKGLPATALAEYVPRINAVTAEQVREAGRRYFASRDQLVGVAGDAKAIVPDLEQFGKVETITP